MNRNLLRKPGVGRLAILSVIISLHGCSASDPLSMHGVQVRIPEGWSPYAPGAEVFAGERLASFKCTSASIDFYRTLRVPGAKASNLGRDQVTRIENLPGYTIVSEEVRQVGGLEASVVEITAPGDGFSWAPSGLGKPVIPPTTTPILTHRLAVGFPRQADTLWIVCHYADAAKARFEIDAILKTVAIADAPIRSSSY